MKWLHMMMVLVVGIAGLIGFQAYNAATFNKEVERKQMEYDALLKNYEEVRQKLKSAEFLKEEEARLMIWKNDMEARQEQVTKKGHELEAKESLLSEREGAFAARELAEEKAEAERVQREADAKAALSMLQKQVREQTEALSQTNLVYATAMKQLEEAKVRSERQQKECENQLQDLQKEIAGATARQLDVESRVDSLSAMTNAQTKALAQLKQEVDSLVERVVALRSEKKELEDVCRKLESDREVLTSALAQESQAALEQIQKAQKEFKESVTGVELAMTQKQAELVKTMDAQTKVWTDAAKSVSMVASEVRQQETKLVQETQTAVEAIHKAQNGLQATTDGVAKKMEKKQEEWFKAVEAQVKMLRNAVLAFAKQVEMVKQGGVSEGTNESL